MRKGKGGSKKSEACMYTCRRTAEDTLETDISKNMPDREAVSGIYRTIRLSTKTYIEKNLQNVLK